MQRSWQIRAAADEPKVGELLLYGPFGPSDAWAELLGETTPAQVRDALDALGDIDELRVYVDSMGGDVFAGQAIHSILARFSGRVIGYVDGIAGSAATLPLMACNRVLMPRNSMLFVHKPWTITMGNDTDHDRAATTLRAVKKSMVAAYQAKTGLDDARIDGLLQAHGGEGTWITAQEAVDLGFADEVEPSKQIAASLVRPGLLAVNGREHDISRFKNLPEFPEAERDAGRGKPTKRDVEDALRDAGFSRRDVKQALAEGWREPVRDAPPPPDLDALHLEFLRTQARLMEGSFAHVG